MTCTLLALTLLASFDVPAPARLIVECPADVELIIDGQPTVTSGTIRRFQTPPLPAGEVFVYDIRILRRGQEVAARRAHVQAGRTTRLSVALDERPAPAVPPGPTAGPAHNFGIDLEKLRPASQAELNGAPISIEAAEQLLRGDDRLPDPHRRRLTIIGGPDDRKQARLLLDGPLRDLAADYLIDDYPPDHWAVARSGFFTQGKPTIYAQEPDGRVLFRQDDLAGLERNLQAVRKPSPDYRPDADPDYRRAAPWAAMIEQGLPPACLLAVVFFLWKAKRT
jgi:uncharacterized protein (TIGR03000 family)